MRKYALAIDLILLLTCTLLLLVDLKIKNDLIQQAMKLEEKLDEQRRLEGNGNIHSVVPGNLSNGHVSVDASIPLGKDTANVQSSPRPRKRNPPATKRSAGDADKGISGQDNAVGS
jgi:hypothetical protein